MSTCLMLGLAFVLGISEARAKVADDKAFVMDLRDLASRADLVIQGRVLGIDRTVRETEVRIQIDGVFQGEKPDAIVTARSASGKVYIDPNEPEFNTYDQAIFFLARQSEGSFTVVDGKFGKKNIVNGHVYINPTNPFAYVKFKRYLEELTALANENYGRS